MNPSTMAAVLTHFIFPTLKIYLLKCPNTEKPTHSRTEKTVIEIFVMHLVIYQMIMIFASLKQGLS